MCYYAACVDGSTRAARRRPVSLLPETNSEQLLTLFRTEMNAYKATKRLCPLMRSCEALH